MWVRPPRRDLPRHFATSQPRNFTASFLPGRDGGSTSFCFRKVGVRLRSAHLPPHCSIRPPDLSACGHAQADAESHLGKQQSSLPRVQKTFCQEHAGKGAWLTSQDASRRRSRFPRSQPVPLMDNHVDPVKNDMAAFPFVRGDSIRLPPCGKTSSTGFT